jgi:assimilatory nitrate reductase catalytic subunit
MAIAFENIGIAVRDLDAVAGATGAGASCGSCRPEIARLLSATSPQVRHAA